MGVLATAAACWVAYVRVDAALTGAFVERLSRLAATAASQVEPEAVAEARRAGDEGGGYLAIQVQLVTLRSAAGLDNASVIDASGITLVDVAAPDVTERLATPLDAVAHAALARAKAGAAAVSDVYTAGGRPRRAAFAPVRDGAAVVAVVAVEAEPGDTATLAALARRLALIVLLGAVVIALFAALSMRAAVASARLERRLSRSENLAGMGRLTATLAHEIKNPLAIIRGSAERLRGADPESHRMAQFVIEETDRLSRTVARYLQFAKTEPEPREAGDALRPRETGDALRALDATLALLEGEFAARAITLERFRDAGDSASVRLDPESLKQVYLNLLLNAAEAMPEGGALRVAERGDGARVEIEIEDHGQGIPPEVLARIGSPFLTTKARGSGLGLFLTRRLVESAGGTLAIRSEVGRGTTCIVRWPRAGG